MPTVRKFAKMLVLIGAVFACVKMAFAAMAVIFGHKDAGLRVAGTVGGLVLLFCGYTIYKIVMVNAFRLDKPEFADAPEWLDERPQPVDGLDPNAPPAADAGVTPLAPSDTPPVRNAPAGRARSNLPVSPFGANR
jgi:hypothetical protein